MKIERDQSFRRGDRVKYSATGIVPSLHGREGVVKRYTMDGWCVVVFDGIDCETRIDDMNLSPVKDDRCMIYQIEQDPRDPKPWYDGLGLPACKARARRLSKTSSYCHVYILCHRSQSEPPVGQIVFCDGRLDYTDGEIA